MFPIEIWLRILSFSGMDKDIKNFINLYPVCRMFRFLCIEIGTPIKYPFEALHVLSPKLFAQATNYMLLEKQYSRDLVLSEKIKSLYIRKAKDINIFGEKLDTLVLVGDSSDKSPKIRVKEIKSLDLGYYQLEEDTFLSLEKTKYLVISSHEQKYQEILKNNKNFEALFYRDCFPPCILDKTCFSNLIYIRGIDLSQTTLEYLPKLSLLEECRLQSRFFTKECNLLKSMCYKCTNSDRFYMETENLFIILDNLQIKHLYCKKYLPNLSDDKIITARNFYLDLVYIDSQNLSILIEFLKLHKPTDRSTIKLNTFSNSFVGRMIKERMHKVLPQVVVE